MNTNDYNEACLNILKDEEFYETVCDGPNPKYRISLDKIIDKLNVAIDFKLVDNFIKGYTIFWIWAITDCLIELFIF